ncbi:MAG: CotH kinase family protein [Eubacterium sp.]|nr:CotH kinase family protein [Eubacterium sp.]
MRMRTAWKKITTTALVLAMAVSGLGGFAPTPSSAKTTVIRYDDTYDPAVADYDAYTVRNFAQVFEDSKLTVSIKDDKLTPDYVEDGLRIKAKATDIEEGEIVFEQAFDFGKYKPGFLIVNGLSERKKEAAVSVYLDSETTPLGSVIIPAQRGKDKWNYNKNNSVDISGKNITGKHTVRLKIRYGKLSADKKKDKTEILLRTLLFTAFDIPTVRVNIDENYGTIAEMNSDGEHITECYGDMSIQTPSGYRSEYGGADCSGTYELEYIRGRGNSTWGTPKKPYRLKLDKKADLFGMGADKNWVLLANYYDYSLIRNKYTYWLGDKFGMAYTPQCVFVNFVMNGEYLGSYYLCEHVRVGKARIDIDDLEDEPDAVTGSAVTGGYLLSLGSEEGEYRTFETKKGVSLLIERPDFGDNKPVPEQYDYIRNYVQQMEDALYGDDFKDDEGRSYTDFLDLQSAVDYYLFQEFSLNGDGYCGGSNYLYKKRDGKLYWGPLWDFDYVAWGATEFSQNQTEGFSQTFFQWNERMMKDKAFKDKLLERWEVLKPILEQSIAPGGEIDKLSEQLYMSQKANYYVASTVHDQDYGYDSETGTLTQVSFDSEIARFKEWIGARIRWVDANIGKEIKTKGYMVTFKIGKKIYDKVKVNGGYIYGDMLPKEPKKKGYNFRGWFVKDTNGAEYNLTYQEVRSNLTAYARFVKKDTIKGGSKIFFSMPDLYYPADDGSGYSLAYGSYPATITPDKIKWSTNTAAARVSDGLLFVDTGFLGTVKVTAKYKKTKISCRVHICDWTDLVGVRTLAFKKKNITMTKGSYQVLHLNPSPKKVNANGFIGGISYHVQKPNVIDVDGNGVVHALKKGKSVVVASFDGQMLFCNITVKNKKKSKKK